MYHVKWPRVGYLYIMGLMDLILDLLLHVYMKLVVVNLLYWMLVYIHPHRTRHVQNVSRQMAPGGVRVYYGVDGFNSGFTTACKHKISI